MNEIQKRLIAIINTSTFDRALGFVLLHGASLHEMKDAYLIALWLEGAPKEVKTLFLQTFGSPWDDTGMRVCSSCGAFITEGYVLPEDDYACSERCAVKNYIRDIPGIGPEEAEKKFRQDLDDNPDECYWTEWYQERRALPPARKSPTDKPRFDAFRLLPRKQREGVTDSLLLDSGVEIISARVDGFDFSIRTQGYVTIVWKGETYTRRCDFPDDLVDAIRNHTVDSSPDGCVNENNWYELLIWDRRRPDAAGPVYSDLIDLDDLTTLGTKEAKELILDCLGTAKECAGR